MSQRYDDLRRVENEVAALIRRVKRVIGERAHAVHPDLQPAGLLMLDRIAGAGPVRATELAAEFALDKGAVSRHVQQLVDLGLLAREPDPDDRRAALLVATPEADRRLERMRQLRSERFDYRLADWPDAEVAAFADRLARYNAALDDRLAGVL